MKYEVELIETLWNVNSNCARLKIYVHLELIETLWNVNIVPVQKNVRQALRINRNIVECKCINVDDIGFFRFSN